MYLVLVSDALLVAFYALFGAGLSILMRAAAPKRLVDHPSWFWKKFWGCIACAGARGSLVGVILISRCGYLHRAGVMTVAEALVFWICAIAPAAYLYSLVYPPPLELP